MLLEQVPKVLASISGRIGGAEWLKEEFEEDNLCILRADIDYAL